jgi:ketosteroid isomerase-like protein
MRYVPFLLVLIALILGACQPIVVQPVSVAPEQDAAAQQKLEEEQFVEAAMAAEHALQSGDVDRLIEFYADDAVSMPPGVPAMTGKEAIAADIRFFYDQFGLEREFELVGYEVTGDYATRTGEWTQTLTPKAGGDPIVETGRCVLGFKKVGDEWKVAWEIWNTY